MLISFTEPVSDTELNQVLSGIEEATKDTGRVESSSAGKHIAVPDEESIPAFIGSAVLQIGVTDLAALLTACWLTPKHSPISTSVRPPSWSRTASGASSGAKPP